MQVLLVRHGKTQGNLEHRYVGRTDEPLLAEERARLMNSCYEKFHPDIVYCSKMLRCKQTAEILFFHPKDINCRKTYDEDNCETYDEDSNETYDEDSRKTYDGDSSETYNECSRKTCDEGSREILSRLTEDWGYKPQLEIRDGLEETDFGEFEYKNYEELKNDPAYQAWIDSGGMLAFPGGESGKDFRKRCCRAFEECIEDANRRQAKRIALVIHGGTIMSVMEAYGRPKADFYSWQAANGEGFLTELFEAKDGGFCLMVYDGLMEKKF